MNLDDAIEHAAEVAYYKGFCKCGREHEQLALWLAELKSRREADKMAEMKQPEDAVRVIMDALRFLEQAKVKAERPIPVLKDKNGKLTKDYTVKEHLMKLHEEVLEFESEVQAFSKLDAKPRDMKELYVENKAIIAGEACDIITVLYGICKQFGIDENFMDSVMHNTYIKNRDRGYFDDVR